MTRSIGFALALALAACESTTSTAPPAAGPSTAPPAAAPSTAPATAPSTAPGPGSAATVQPDTTQMLGAMASLAGKVAEPQDLAAWAQKIDSGQAPLDGYIDEVLGTERFANEVIPSLMFAAFVNVRNYYALPSAFVLKHPDDSDGPLYLRAPCTADQAIAVHPWWSLDTEVKVCPDSYRPDKWTLAPNEHKYRTAMALSCDSQVGSPELETNSLCGCGPNLIRCLRDMDQYDEINRSFMAEVKRTTAYVVDHDLPMSTLFTSNATFRDRNVELYYRRQKIGALEIKDVAQQIADLAAWPDDGQWAPREELRPGQHAGVLTAPQILHWLPDRRQRQRGYYEMMWCNLRNSFGATTHKVLELNATGNNFFVHDSWERLAHTEMCMNCHARLDYGSRFFLGYPDSRAGTLFNPALQAPGNGPLYGQDIRDLRGEAPLTPYGFARLATDQPDFQSCMTNHFVNYVLGERATGDDIKAIEDAVSATRTFKGSMKVALERYAVRWREDTHASPAAPVAPVAPVAGAQPPPPGSVAIGPALRSQLDQHCGDCHDEAPYTDNPDGDNLPFDFKGNALPRPLVVRMADHVAFGIMPKNQFLDPRVRDGIVETLVDTLWTDPAARTEAEHYYLGKAHGLPAQQFDNVLYEIDHSTRATPNIAWGALERGIWSDQSTITPGFLAISGLEALGACTQASQVRHVTLVNCLRDAVSLKILSRWPPASSTP